MVQAPHIPIGLDLASVVIGAIFGALLARRNGFDVAGFVGLAVVNGMGGGILRDLLLGQVPIALTSWSYIPLAVAMGVGVFVVQPPERWLHGRPIRLLSALNLGVFAVAGSAKALATGDVHAPGAVFIGVIAAVAGGATCDLLTGHRPEIFHTGPLHSIVAAIGAAAFVLLADLGVHQPVSTIVAVGLAFTLRVLALARGWYVPTPAGVVPTYAERRKRLRERAHAHARQRDAA